MTSRFICGPIELWYIVLNVPLFLDRGLLTLISIRLTLHLSHLSTALTSSQILPHSALAYRIPVLSAPLSLG